MLEDQRSGSDKLPWAPRGEFEHPRGGSHTDASPEGARSVVPEHSRYKDLLHALAEAQMENEFLREENARLKEKVKLLEALALRLWNRRFS